MRLFTLVWGQKHLDWFEKGCVRSLTWPSNREALLGQKCTWDIFTTEEDAPRARLIAEPLGVPVETHIISERGSGDTLQLTLIAEMERCVALDEPMLICPPDTIWGDGAVASVVTEGRFGHCIAVAHVRVTPGILAEIAEAPVTNPELVGAAWKHLHRTWSEANEDLPMTNSLVSGVSWKEARPGLYLVHHKLPTCYFAKFTADDVPFFKAQQFVGAWDHLWPSILVAEQRQRTLGASDAAFLVELTPEFQNIPAPRPAADDRSQRRWGSRLHHMVNRNCVSVFRSCG